MPKAGGGLNLATALANANNGEFLYNDGGAFAGQDALVFSKATNQVRLKAGVNSNSHPYFVSANNAGTGFYFGTSSNFLGLMLEGTVRFTVQATLAKVTTPFTANNGSLSQPDFGHVDSPGQGIFFESSTKASFVSNSTRTAHWDNNAFVFEKEAYVQEHITFDDKNANDTPPVEDASLYVKGTKLVCAYNDGISTYYYTLDLSNKSSQQWTYSATAP